MPKCVMCGKGSLFGIGWINGMYCKDCVSKAEKAALKLCEVTLSNTRGKSMSDSEFTDVYVSYLTTAVKAFLVEPTILHICTILFMERVAPDKARVMRQMNLSRLLDNIYNTLLPNKVACL